MPVVRTTRNHDDTFHGENELEEIYTTSRTLLGPGGRSPTKGRGRQLIRRNKPTSSGTRRAPKGRPTQSRLRQSTTYDILVEDQSSQPCDIYSNEHYDTGSLAYESQLNLLSEPGTQERFEEDVMIYYQAMVDQFLKDHETPENIDQMMVDDDIQLPTTSSSTLADGTAGDGMEWDLDPTSFHLLDMNKFETVTDFDGCMKKVPWPWGDQEYRHTAPETYLDPEDYVMEYQCAEMGEVLREEAMEASVQQAILAGEEMKRMERKGKKSPRKKAKRETEGEKVRQSSTIAFNNQVVRGRNIYRH